MEFDRLIQDLNLKKVRVKDEEIMASCPFAEERHSSGMDKHPSFSINMEKGVYNCFTCGSRGTIEYLVSKVLSIPVTQALDYLEEIGLTPMELSVIRYINLDEEDETQRYIPEMILENFTRRDNDKYEIYDGIVDDKDCIIYIVRDYKQNLVGAVARSKDGRYHKNLWNMAKKYYLLGEQYITPDTPLVVVEGPGDLLAVKSAGYSNVVALMGSTMSIEQAEKLCKFTDTVILWLDADKAGFNGTYKAFNLLSSYGMDMKFVNTDDMTEDEKDPRDVYEKRGAEAVMSLIQDAQTYLEQLYEAEGGVMEDKD